MKKLVVLTGAGVSAESGIATFRDSGGLWEGHDIMEVASPEGWAKDPELVLDFYNLRRQDVREAQPNPAHYALAELEEHFDTTIITQNVDDLHERGGSTNVLHLHGELLKSQSTKYPDLLYDVEGDIKMGDLCEKGYQLRPQVVWFGEAVPMIEKAMAISEQADIFIVIGTSMIVYPAAGLINYVPDEVPKYLIDPNAPEISYIPNLITYNENASTGVQKLVELLLKPNEA
ncbi:MAG: NAD-dependent deacylase [Bacteroidetes bacterium]|nr:NAD-dependent deacylase [Bacteroidota bacterium]